jgi:hypothetical protein
MNEALAAERQRIFDYEGMVLSELEVESPAKVAQSEQSSGSLTSRLLERLRSRSGETQRPVEPSAT